MLGRAWPALWIGAALLEVAAGGVAVWLAGRHGPALLAVLINLAVCLRFAATLRPGRVPLITRYARFDPQGLPAECEGYTRALTLAWAVLTAAFALVHAGAVLDLWSMRLIALLQSAAFLTLFLGEHPLRAWLFPQLGRVTPWRTVRAMVSSFGAPHAA
jgi:uncharacterized membrane protein